MMRHGVYAFCATVAVAVLPLVVSDQYVLHLGVLILLAIPMATGLNLVMGVVGQLPLGFSVFYGLGAYVSAIMASNLGMSLLVALPIGAVICAAFGGLIGYVTLRLRGPFFAIITLCFSEVFRLVANNWIAVTNGPMGMSSIPRPSWIAALDGLHQKEAFYYLALGLALASVYLGYRLMFSNLGRAAVAIRENRFVARSIGISPMVISLTFFIFAAAMSGASGVIYASYVSFVGPDVFSFSIMVSLLIMVLIGGRSTLVGPLIGVVIVVLLEEYLRDLRELRLSIFGLIVVVAAVFLPNGIASLWHRRAAAPSRG